jgi:hypothetical protein
MIQCILLESKSYVLNLEKRIQEIISIILSIVLMIYDFYFICRYFNMRNWYLIIPSACMLKKNLLFLMIIVLS